MFGDTTIFYVMIWNHPIETTIKNWLFGVPGIYIYTQCIGSCWGHPFFSLFFRQDVHEIVASHRAFAARRGNGSVVTWGDTLLGGDCSMVPRPQLKGMDFGLGAVVYTA